MGLNLWVRRVRVSKCYLTATGGGGPWSMVATTRMPPRLVP